MHSLFSRNIKDELSACQHSTENLDTRCLWAPFTTRTSPQPPPSHPASSRPRPHGRRWGKPTATPSFAQGKERNKIIIIKQTKKQITKKNHSSLPSCPRFHRAAPRCRPSPPGHKMAAAARQPRAPRARPSPGTDPSRPCPDLRAAWRRGRLLSFSVSFPRGTKRCPDRRGRRRRPGSVGPPQAPPGGWSVRGALTETSSTCSLSPRGDAALCGKCPEDGDFPAPGRCFWPRGVERLLWVNDY